VSLRAGFAIVLLCQLWMLPLLVALEVLPGGTSNAWARYAILVLAVGYPFVHAILVALTLRNAGSVRTRTVGSALYNMSVQASSIIALMSTWTTTSRSIGVATKCSSPSRCTPLC
jgi:hypothetical protein